MKVGDWVVFEWGGEDHVGVVKRLGGGSVAIDCNGVDYCVLEDERVRLMESVDQVDDLELGGE